MASTIGHQYQNLNTKSMAKTILVIGGAGYIGSHICKVLAKNGYSPVIIDHNLKNKPWADTFGPAFNLNLPIDLPQLGDLIKRYAIDTVINLAAYTAVGESVANPSKYYKNNLVMTLQLLDKLIELDIKKFVFSSSAAVYGIPEDKDGICFDAEGNEKPINPYGQTKLMVEKILRDYHKAHGLNSISLRYFNAAGADPDAEVGELRDLETHIIPLAINASLRGNEFNMFGDDYKTPDGTCVRDYIHVMDLADAHIQAINLVGNGIDCNSFNLGSGIPTSNKQLLDSVKKFTGDFKINIKPRRPGDPDSLVADISNTMKYLNWQPQLSSIDKIVSTAVNWHKKANKKEIQ